MAARKKKEKKEPTVTVTLAEADAARRAVLGDYFETKHIESFIKKVEAARSETQDE